MYLNYFKTEICQPDDNPPIGIVLGAKKDELLMEYAMDGISNQLFAARYQLYLPNKEELQAQLTLTISNPMTQRYDTYKEIECIKEYKQRLISDVATGQIKVC